jgi:hypothetical protein
MKKVTLLFKDKRDLLRFHIILGSDCTEPDPTSLRLTCECSDEEIELAKTAFGATVVELEQVY